MLNIVKKIEDFGQKINDFSGRVREIQQSCNGKTCPAFKAQNDESEPDNEQKPN